MKKQNNIELEQIEWNFNNLCPTICKIFYNLLYKMSMSWNLGQQDICSRTQMRINEKSFNKKNLIIKSFLAAQIEEKNTFGDTSTKPNIGIL
jgi:hypothetical protein